MRFRESVMTYLPSESEKRVTAIVQALAGILLFIPPLVVLRSRVGRRSPYVKYWAKVCLFWSLMMTVIIVTAVACARILTINSPAIVFAIVHFVFCVTGAMSSYFNTPFRYWFVANTLCESELGDVYGQLIPPPPAARRRDN